MWSLLISVSLLALLADLGLGAAPEKPGTCPISTNMMGICLQGCNSDSDCTGTRKCCSNGCGNICTDPVPSGDLCEKVFCGAGLKCVMKSPPCMSPMGCPEAPTCVVDDPCQNVRCPDGQKCIVDTAPCTTNALCPPTAHCVTSTVVITQRKTCADVKCQPTENCIMNYNCLPCAAGVPCPACEPQPQCVSMAPSTPPPSPTSLCETQGKKCGQTEICSLTPDCPPPCVPGTPCQLRPCTIAATCVKAGNPATTPPADPCTTTKCGANERCEMQMSCTSCPPNVVPCPVGCSLKPACVGQASTPVPRTTPTPAPTPSPLSNCLTTKCAVNERCEMQMSCTSCPPNVVPCPVGCFLKPACVAQASTPVLRTTPTIAPTPSPLSDCQSTKCGANERCEMQMSCVSCPPNVIPCPVGCFLKPTCVGLATTPVPRTTPTPAPTPSPLQDCLTTKCAANERCEMQTSCVSCPPNAGPCPALCFLTPKCVAQATGAVCTLDCGPGMQCTMLLPPCPAPPTCPPGQTCRTFECRPQPTCVPIVATPTTPAPTTPSTRNVCANKQCGANERCVVQPICPPCAFGIQCTCSEIAVCQLNEKTTTSPLPTCATISCPQGQQCVMRDATAVCQPVPTGPCATVTCRADESCQVVYPPCARPTCLPGMPCPPPPSCQPQGVCIPAANLPRLTCATVDCIANYQCVMGTDGPRCVPSSSTTQPPRKLNPCETMRCASGAQCVVGPNGAARCETTQTTTTPFNPCSVVRCTSGTQCVVASNGAARCEPIPTTAAPTRTTNPCDGVRCPGGQQCQLQQVQCIQAPCLPVATCIAISNPCAGVICPAGQQCQLQQVACFVAPCPPLAQCTTTQDPCAKLNCKADQQCIPPPAGCNGPNCPPATCVSTATKCGDTTCRPGQQCVTRAVFCIRAPCPAVSECV